MFSCAAGTDIACWLLDLTVKAPGSVWMNVTLANACAMQSALPLLAHRTGKAIATCSLVHCSAADMHACMHAYMAQHIYVASENKVNRVNVGNHTLGHTAHHESA